MNKKRLLQVSIAAAIAAVLLIPGNIFVIGQVLPDTTAPSVTITQPTVGANLNTANVTAAGTATDDAGVVSVEIFLDNVSQGNAVLTPANGTSVSWSMTLTLLAQGAHNVRATAKDNADNTQSASVNFVVDTVPPSILAPLPITVQANTAGGALSTHPNITAFLSGALSLDAVDPNPTVTNNAPTLFPLGTTTVTFTSTDDAGNSASDSSTVTVVDTILPSVTITQPVNGTKFNTTGITVSGTVSDTTVTSVEILLDNVSQGNAALNNTAWTKTLTIAQGSHTITAKAKDGANNTASTSISVIIDTTAPTVSITSPANNANLNTSNVGITGIAADANGVVSVHVSIDNGVFTLASGTTSWSFNATLPDGTHTITAKATDMAGNTNKANVTITVSTLATGITITSPANGAKLNSTDVTITGTVNNPSNVQSVKVSIDGGTPLLASLNTTSGIWKFGPVTLVEGNHTAKATLTNLANNTAMATVSFIVDTTLPQIAITSPSNGATLNTGNVTITGTASDLNGILSVKVSIDSGTFLAANGTNSWSFAATLVDGTHGITAKATDMAENTKTTSITVVIDTGAPTIAITSPVNGAKINSANVTISGTANGGLSSIGSVKVSIDGGTASPASFNSSTGIWTFGPVTLADGNHTAKATATDIANNTAMASVSFIVDTIPPNVAITSPSNGSTLNSTSVNISGTSSDANGVTSVKVSIDSGSFMLANGTTSWSFHATLTTGNHTITAKATDMAGNMKNATISIKIKIPPTVVSELGVFSCEGKSIKGNVIIDDLDVTFINCEVRGNIRISNSNIFVDEESEIRGNFVLTNSDVEIQDTEVRGNFRIKGGSLILTDSTIRGQVKICGTDVIEISGNTYKGGIKFCSEGEGWEDDYEEGKYSKVQDGSNQGSKDNGKNKGKSDQTSGSSGKGGKDEGKSNNDKGKPDDKEKVKGNDGSKSNGNGNGKGNGGEKGNSGKGSDNGNKGNSGKSNGGNGGGNGKGKGKN